jgi:hypothetical protein
VSLNQFRFKNSLLFFLVCLPLLLSNFTACEQSSTQKSRLADFPPVILWAWEQEANLDFLDTKKYGVAFLAQTLEMKNDEILINPRRQQLRVKPEIALIAVTRIEPLESPTLSDKQKNEIISLILKTLDLKNVRAIQIDFDATVSQRDFYQSLLKDLRQKLPENTPLSITALASFCIGDRWLFEAPVDEAVPMIFRMGADDQAVKNYLANGGDFKVKICRQSYGISLDEAVQMNFDKSRRLYIFNPKSWKPADIAIIEEKSK